MSNANLDFNDHGKPPQVLQKRRFVSEKAPENSLSTKNFILINCHDKKTVLDCNDIIMVKAHSNYANIFSINQGQIFTSKTLKYWQQAISNENFIRTHASYLVNRNFITGIDKISRKLHLVNDQFAFISKRNWFFIYENKLIG